MSHLRRKPLAEHGLIHDVTPASAGWRYVGFALHRLAPGERAEARTGGREAILVLVEGKARLSTPEEDFGEMGERMEVFEGTPPHALYVPAESAWRAEATTPCLLAVCTAPGGGDFKARRLGPEGILAAERGTGTNLRRIHNVAMEDREVARSLLVTEVFTPAGHWSSYPPHRHDEDDFPRMTSLEETYYHRLRPAKGFGIQRVFTEDGSLDETIAVADHDVVLVPRGHHPCAAPHGIEMYYLNVMAGPLRKWRFAAHPDFDFLG
ncbi:5-deoxy-glucuronate isomerase [Neomegalonema perideroedes]|uniref:5-deoxy-glucuronate isomerase n=1 Tax=Neomegalonema perideroedes TaxID=217219 RepID=UPI0003704737|nr:5-deoxy-glucuronate isomerase [Neomegalonema perideroedes]